MRLAALLLLAPLILPQEVAWKSDWKATLKEAATSKKLVLLVFQTKDRKNCQRFEEGALKDPAVIAALGKYLCVRVNPEGTDDENRLWQELKSPMPIPITLVFEPDGKPFTTITTLNPKSYGALLQDIVPAYFDKIVPSREALAKDANQPGPNATMGEAYFSIDMAPASARHYAAAVELLVTKGDKGKALEILGAQLDRYYDKKWYVPGRGCCSRIAELDPENKSGKRPLAAWMLGMASCSEGRWGEAIDGLKDACERYKQSDLLPKMMFSLASAYLGAKDLDTAITIYETIVKDYPNTETAELSQIQATKTREQRQKAAEGK